MATDILLAGMRLSLFDPGPVHDASSPSRQPPAIEARSPALPRAYSLTVATWDDVRRIAMALPEAEERISRGSRQWRIRDRLFVWERPLGKKDRRDLGDAAPDGPILGARVEHLVAKQAVLADDPDVFFTIPHFDGYPAILVRLERISAAELEEVIVEAWLNRAPPKLAGAYLAETGGSDQASLP
jgi:hypothetical protein